MKATREQLKALVKELLLEVLREGIGGNPAPVAALPARQAEGRRRPSFDPRLDTPVGGRPPTTPTLREAVRREAGGSSVMAAILSDTAQTTLQEQLSHGDSMGSQSVGAPVQQEQFYGDPADVFGAAAEQRADGSSHWADLAFMRPAKKAA